MNERWKSAVNGNIACPRCGGVGWYSCNCAADAIEADLRNRLVPSAQQLAVAAAIFAADPTADAVMVGVALPNKAHGFWTLGQEVHPVPGFWIASNNPGDGSYSHARDAAERAAKEWLAERGMTRLPAYAVIHRDGGTAVFEGF